VLGVKPRIAPVYRFDFIYQFLEYQSGKEALHMILAIGNVKEGVSNHPAFLR
jgi:hypothetical protein